MLRLVKPVRIIGQLVHLVRRRASSEAFEGGHFPNFCTVSGHCLEGMTVVPVVCNVFADCPPRIHAGCSFRFKGRIRHTAAGHTHAPSPPPGRRVHYARWRGQDTAPGTHRQPLSGGDATGQGRRHWHCAAPRDSASGLQAGRRRCAVVRSSIPPRFSKR